MYKVSIFNSDIETVIHYPSADSDVAKLNKMNIKEGINAISSFSFTILFNNPGYKLISELKTKVRIIDLRDNSVRFTGRILGINETMDSTGVFCKEAICENALAYLLDSNTRQLTYLTDNVSSVLSDLLNRHNAIVDNYKKIYLGNVNVSGSIAYTTDFESTYNAIANALKDITCYFQIREVNGILYLDCLSSLSSTTIDVTLGENMKEMIKKIDVTDMSTRIIPLGANNLSISDVNNGVDYIEDINARNNYGVIEKIVSYTDITDSSILKSKAISDLANYITPKITFEINAIDLSYLTGVTADQFKIGGTLHIFNPVMGIDGLFNITEVDVDLIQMYNPKLTISNASDTLSSTLVAMQNSSLQNNDVKNGVQVGSDFGIRVVSAAKKTTLTMNASDGISIKNDTKTVFSADENGNIICNDITSNDMNANRGTFTDIIAEGGTFNNIVANNIDVEKGTITGATIQTSKPGSGRERIVMTGDIFSSYDSSGNLSFTIDGSRIKIYDSGSYVGSIYGSGNYLQIDLPSNRQFVLTENGFNKLIYYDNQFDFLCNVNVTSNLTLGGGNVATESWVEQYVAANMPSSSTP